MAQDHPARSALPAALEAALPSLRCPVCASRHTAAPLQAGYTGQADEPGPPDTARTVRCPAGHVFDLAKQGYVTLLGGKGRTVTGDTPDQVRRRADFLQAGHYAPLAQAVADAAAQCLDAGGGGRGGGAGGAGGATSGAGREPLVVDVGAGIGYYLAALLERVPGVRGLGTEMSVAAAKRLAKAHPRAAAIIADTWQGLPLATGACDVVTVLFAPRNAAEFARVLVPTGSLIVAWPGAHHLEPLRTELGMLTIEEHKTERMLAELAPHFATDDALITSHQWELAIGPETAVGLALMGPSGAHHTAHELQERAAALPAVQCFVDVRIGVFTRRQIKPGHVTTQRGHAIE